MWYRDEVAKIGFGRGHVDSRFEPAARFRTQLDPIVQEKEVPALEGGDGSSSVCSLDPEAYMFNLLTIAKTVADSMSTLMALIVDAPLHIRVNPTFSNTVQTTSALIGIKSTAADTKADDAPPCSQKLFANDWGMPGWQSTLMRMMEVWEEKQKLENCLGDPSFSLELSQNLIFNRVVSSPVEKDDVAASDHGAAHFVTEMYDVADLNPAEEPHMDKESLKESMMSGSDGRVPAAVIGVPDVAFAAPPLIASQIVFFFNYLICIRYLSLFLFFFLALSDAGHYGGG